MKCRTCKKEIKYRDPYLNIIYVEQNCKETYMVSCEKCSQELRDYIFKDEKEEN